MPVKQTSVVEPESESFFRLGGVRFVFGDSALH